MNLMFYVGVWHLRLQTVDLQTAEFFASSNIVCPFLLSIANLKQADLRAIQINLRDAQANRSAI